MTLATKSMEDRLSEIKTIYSKLIELGLSDKNCSNLKEFKIICNDFVKNGVSASGKIKLNEVSRVLIYVLSLQPHITSNVVLKSI